MTRTCTHKHTRCLFFSPRALRTPSFIFCFLCPLRLALAARKSYCIKANLFVSPSVQLVWWTGWVELSFYFSLFVLAFVVGIISCITYGNKLRERNSYEHNTVKTKTGRFTLLRSLLRSFCSLLVRSDSFMFDLHDPSLSKQHMQF